jgi:hypothetical protein
MKKLIFILPLLMLSCKAPKTVTSRQEVDISMSNNKKMEFDSSQREVTAVVEKLLENIRHNKKIKHISYDTEKPVNPVTGKPPVKEETEIEIEIESNREESQQVIREDSISVIKRDEDKSLDEYHSASRVKEKTRPNSWVLLLSLSVISLIAGILLWINKGKIVPYIIKFIRFLFSAG